jgi:hypothetical protein
MSSHNRPEFHRIDGSAQWQLRQQDASLARELAYREHLRMAQDGVCGWTELPNRLRAAYRRIQADLYSHQEDMVQ